MLNKRSYKKNDVLLLIAIAAIVGAWAQVKKNWLGRLGVRV